MSSKSDLAQVFHRFSFGCDVNHSTMNGLVNRFLALQVNLASWEDVYVHATKGDGGKDLPTFKYQAKEGVIDTYTRKERSHQFGPGVWRSLFEGASIPKELKKNSEFKKNAAGYIGFCQQVCKPISSKFGEDQKLMLYFMLNTKPKNMRQLVHSKDLGLGLHKHELNNLFEKMDSFELNENKEGALAREIGGLISEMSMPVALTGSRLQMELRSMSGGAENVQSSGGQDVARALARIDRGEERKKENTVFSIRGSQPEGWTAEKERAVIANPVVKAYKGKMKIRFAPAKELARQVLVSTLSPQEEHWSMASGQSGQLVNGKLELARKVREDIGELTEDKNSWKDLLQVVGYNKSKHLATTPDVMNFYKHLANAIPQKERREWTSKEMVQRFITAHLPNWEEHWTSSWTMDPKTKRAVSEFLQKQPYPSSTFIKTLVDSF